MTSLGAVPTILVSGGIVFLMRKLGLSQQELAEKTGLTQSTISRIVSYRQSQIKPSDLTKIAAALDTTVDSLFRESPSGSTFGKSQNDRPTEDDQLGFRAYKDSLVTVIRRADTPVTVGIFGPWGSGKTSLMRMMKNDLELPVDGKFGDRTVWFNAWKYGKSDALWRALLLTALDALRPGARGMVATELDDLQTSLYRDVDREETGSFEFDLKAAAKGTLKLSLSSVPLFSEILKQIPGLESSSDDTKKAKASSSGLDELFSAFGRKRLEIHRDQVQFLDQFQKRFGELVAKRIEKGSRLVFFIDDLDRCLPEKAVEVMETIKLFLDAEQCVFVVGVEKKIVEKGVRVKYQGLGFQDSKEDLPIDGDEYLEKIIQIPFHLPKLDLKNITSFTTDSLEGEGFGETVAEVFTAGMEPNPRKLKRVMNVFRLLVTLAEERKKDDATFEVDDELLAKIVVIQTRWRDPLFEDVERYPLLLGILEERFETGTSRLGTREIDALGSEGKRKQGDDPGSVTLEEGSVEGIEGNKAKESGQRTRVETIEVKYLTEDRFRDVYDLEKLLAAGEKHFRGMTEQQLQPYVFLTAAVAEEAEAEPERPRARPASLGRIDDRVWEELISSDPTRVQTAAGRLEKDQQPAYIDRLLRIVEDQRQNDLQTRIGAGNALGALGDPRNDPLKPEMVTIPAGTFTMGGDGGDDDEKPAHLVALDAYAIAKYPLTNQEYLTFLQDIGSDREDRMPGGWAQDRFPTGKANHPVVDVSWEDVTAYGEWLNEKSGQFYQLPTEAQWERAARGPGNQTYPWGDEFVAENCDTREGGVGGTTPVGIYPAGASPEGALDMSGNVFEWCSDWFDESYYETISKESEVRNPTGPETGKGRVVHGGSFFDTQFSARCSFRGRFTPVIRYSSLGVRFSRTLTLNS